MPISLKISPNSAFFSGSDKPSMLFSCQMTLQEKNHNFNKLILNMHRYNDELVSLAFEVLEILPSN